MVTTGTGTLTIDSDVVVNTIFDTDGTSPAAVINGFIDLTGATTSNNTIQQFIINPTLIPSNNNDLTVNAVISDIPLLSSSSLPNSDGSTGFDEPGLRESSVANSGFQTYSSNNPGSDQFIIRNGESNGNNSTNQGNQTSSYVGQVYIPVATTISFAESQDDGGFATVDGVLVCSNNSNTGSFGSIFVSSGWHDIDLGVYNNGGGGAATGNFAGSGFNANFGYGWAPFGTAVTGGFNTAEIMPFDNGSGILFRSAAGNSDGGIYKNGIGTMTVTSNNSGLTGPTTVNQGQLIFSGNGAVSGVENAVQQLNLAPTTNGGTFTLSYNGQTTAPIPFQPASNFTSAGFVTFGGVTTQTTEPAANAMASAIQAALQALPGIGAGNVVVSPIDLITFAITFTGALAGMPQNTIISNLTTLSPAGANAAIGVTNTGGADHRHDERRRLADPRQHRRRRQQPLRHRPVGYARQCQHRRAGHDEQRLSRRHRQRQHADHRNLRPNPLAGNTTNTIESTNLGGTANWNLLDTAGFNRGGGATLSIDAFGAPLGTVAGTGNSIRLNTTTTVLAAQGTFTTGGSGILPYAQLNYTAPTGAETVDLTGDAQNFALPTSWMVGAANYSPVSSLTTTAPGAINIKETGNDTIPANNDVVNGLVLAGGTLNLGANNLISSSGQVVSTGGSITGTGELFFNGLETLYFGGGANQQQTLTVTATSGTFTLATTAVPENLGLIGPNIFFTQPIPFNATAAQVQAALQAMPDVGLNNAFVTSPMAGTYIITFANNLGGGNLPLLQVNNFLNGGTASVAITTTGGANTTITPVIQGTGAVRKEDLGTLTVNNNNTVFTGQATIDQGIVDMQAANAFGVASVGITVNGAAELDLGGTGVGAITVGNKGLNINGNGFLEENDGGLRMLSSGGVTDTWGTGRTGVQFNGGPSATAGGQNVATLAVDSAADQLVLNATVSFNSNFWMNQGYFATPLTGGTQTAFEPAGTLSLAGTANNGGGGYVDDFGGVLLLSKTGTNIFAVPNNGGGMNIGNNDGGPGFATVKLNAPGIQVLTFAGALANGTTTYTVAFNGGAGGTITTETYTGVAATDAANIKAALVADGAVAGNVTVTPGAAGVFTVTFALGTPSYITVGGTYSANLTGGGTLVIANGVHELQNNGNYNIMINRSGSFWAEGISDTIIVNTTLFITDGTFYVTSPNDTTTVSNVGIFALQMQGGLLQTGAGTLTLGQNITENYGVQSVIAGTLNLNPIASVGLETAFTATAIEDHVFAVQDTVAVDDLNITALITGNGDSITKNNNGALLLANPGNNWTGVNNVETLNLIATTTSGTFALTYNQATTDLIPFVNDGTGAGTVANIAAALAALPTIGSVFANGIGYGTAHVYNPATGLFTNATPTATNANVLITITNATTFSITFLTMLGGNIFNTSNFAIGFPTGGQNLTGTGGATTATITNVLNAPNSAGALNSLAGMAGLVLNGGILDLGANTAASTGAIVIMANLTIWGNNPNNPSQHIFNIPNPLSIGQNFDIGARRDYGGNTFGLTGPVALNTVVNSVNFEAPIDGPLFVNTQISVDDEANLTNPNGVTPNAVDIVGNIGSDIAGRTLLKNGQGMLILGGNNSYSGAVQVNLGVLDVENSGALGTGTTTVFVNGNGFNNATPAALWIDGTSAAGPVNITNKVIQLQQTSWNNGYLQDYLGSLYNVAGNNSITAPYTETPLANEVSPQVALDLKSVNNTQNLQSTVGVNTGSTLDVIGMIAGMQSNANSSATLLYKVGGGDLRTSGTAFNQIGNSEYIFAGTYEINKTPGVLSLNSTPITVGDRVSNATLQLDGAAQESNPSANSIVINDTGTLDTSHPLATANEQQMLYLGGATSGTYTLSYGGATTTALNFNASAFTVQAALQAMFFSLGLVSSHGYRRAGA